MIARSHPFLCLYLVFFLIQALTVSLDWNSRRTCFCRFFSSCLKRVLTDAARLCPRFRMLTIILQRPIESRQVDEVAEAVCQSVGEILYSQMGIVFKSAWNISSSYVIGYLFGKCITLERKSQPKVCFLSLFGLSLQKPKEGNHDRQILHSIL